MQTKYTKITTPGHGYLSVSIKELKRLNLVDKVSGGSFMNLTRVFLEEDCDLALFFDAKEKLNEEFDIKYSYRDAREIVPCSWYNPKHIHNPIQLNSVVTNGKDIYKVVQINKTKIVVENDSGRFSVPISNPYKYIRPS